MANVIRLDKVKGYPVSFENSIENLEQGFRIQNRRRILDS